MVSLKIAALAGVLFGQLALAAHIPRQECAIPCEDGKTCQDGKCKPASCAPGTEVCEVLPEDWRCVDYQTDDHACGACANICFDGPCVGGVCVGGNSTAPPETGCADGLIDCGGTCTDTMTDNANCNVCGLACADGKTCQEGLCKPPSCAAGTDLCEILPEEWECVDYQTNERACGSCGHVCFFGTCVNGECVEGDACAPGSERCVGDCADLQTDPRHCGACFTDCGEGNLCEAGICRPASCPAGQELCHEGALNTWVCSDLLTDGGNCGECGNFCVGGCFNGTCDDGTGCPTGNEVCDGACTDLKTDPKNCNTCGNDCGPGMACRDGMCQPESCPPGQDMCPWGASTDEWHCTDQQTDDRNCGGCGNMCRGDEACIGGKCTWCDQLTLCTLGAFPTCVNTTVDAANCGACGNRCAPSQSCVGGTCEGATNCPRDQVWCSSTERCTNTRNDNLNCGACGTVCGLGRNCVDGECAGSGCGEGQIRCENTCHNPANDNKHCGECWNACEVGKNCVAGKCT
jgi:hypothetical protein